MNHFQQSSHWWGHVTLVRPCSHYYGFIWYTRLLCSTCMWHSLHIPSKLLTLVHSDMWTRCDRLIKHQQLYCPIESYIPGPIRLSNWIIYPRGPLDCPDWKLDQSNHLSRGPRHLRSENWELSSTSSHPLSPEYSSQPPAVPVFLLLSAGIDCNLLVFFLAWLHYFYFCKPAGNKCPSTYRSDQPLNKIHKPIILSIASPDGNL